MTGKDQEQREESDWWLVADKWDFDNIGFLKTIDGMIFSPSFLPFIVHDSFFLMPPYSARSPLQCFRDVESELAS